MIVSVSRAKVGNIAATWLAPEVRHVAIGREAYFYFTEDQSLLGDADNYEVVSSDAAIASFKQELERYKPDVAELPANKKAEFYATIGL